MLLAGRPLGSLPGSVEQARELGRELGNQVGHRHVPSRDHQRLLSHQRQQRGDLQQLSRRDRKIAREGQK